MIMKLQFEKKTFLLPITLRNLILIDPSLIEANNDFAIFELDNTSKATEAKIEVVLTPYFQVYESTVIFSDEKVVKWEKSQDKVMVRSGHLMVINEADMHLWVNGNYGDQIDNDYRRVCESDIRHSCGLVKLMQGGSVCSFQFGNWEWHAYLGYDDQGNLARIALPFEKDSGVYNETASTVHTQDEDLIRLNAALVDQKATVTFISMNFEDMMPGKGNPVFQYDNLYDAMKKAYETDWETTKLHAPKVRCGEYEFSGEGIEDWCRRNGIPEPQFLTDRIQRYYKELIETKEKTKDLK
jgi:hypothetical protein